MDHWSEITGTRRKPLTLQQLSARLCAPFREDGSFSIRQDLLMFIMSPFFFLIKNWWYICFKAKLQRTTWQMLFVCSGSFEADHPNRPSNKITIGSAARRCFCIQAGQHRDLMQGCFLSNSAKPFTRSEAQSRAASTSQGRAVQEEPWEGR